MDLSGCHGRCHRHSNGSLGTGDASVRFGLVSEFLFTHCYHQYLGTSLGDAKTKVARTTSYPATATSTTTRWLGSGSRHCCYGNPNHHHHQHSLSIASIDQSCLGGGTGIGLVRDASFVQCRTKIDSSHGPWCRGLGGHLGRRHGHQQPSVGAVRPILLVDSRLGSTNECHGLCLPKHLFYLFGYLYSRHGRLGRLVGQFSGRCLAMSTIWNCGGRRSQQLLHAAEEEDDEREAGLHLSLLSASVSTATATTTVVEEHLDKTLLTVDQVHEEEAMTAGFVPRYMGNSTHDDDAWITRMAASTTATMASAATMEIATTDDGAAGSHASSATTAVTTTTTTSHVPFVSLPDRKSFLDLVKLSGPIFLVMMSQVTCYNIGTLRVPEFGIVTLAAHNIMMRIFFFFAYIGDAIGQAALCFYPQVSKPQRRPLLKRLFILSIATGVLSSLGAVGLLERFGFLLTKDVSIRTVLATHGQYIGWAILLHPFAMLLEGTLMAQRYFKRLLRSYSLSVAVHMGIVLFSPWTASFQHLWRATFVYEAIRLLQFASAELWFTTGRDKVKSLFRRRQQHSSSSSSSSSTVPS
jgi:hypothetical protein